MIRKILIGSGILTVLVLVATITVKANQYYFATTVQTATATTTLSYMTPGTATTTTPVLDTYTIQDGPNAADKIALLTQLTASTTSTVLGIDIEYSQGGAGLNCVSTPSSCDWYKNNYTSDVSTTSPVISLGLPQTFSWAFASSTLQGVPVTTQRATKIINIQTPTRYVRAVYYLTGANGAVWGQLVPKVQSSN